MTMKNKNNQLTGKNLDLLIAKISVKEILGVNEMICIRGGDGTDTLPPPPPPDPKP